LPPPYAVWATKQQGLCLQGSQECLLRFLSFNAYHAANYDKFSKCNGEL
jgi:hypothetical protein